MKATQERMVKGSLWMALLGLALFWVPAVNGLVAGLIGGYRIGNIWRALLVAAISGVVLGLGIWALFAALSPYIGLVAGVAIASWVLVSEVGLFAGAALGAMSHPVEAGA
jgi:hypothetical protein